MDAKAIDKEFHRYLETFKADKELGQMMSKITFQELFNEKFLKENSKFTSMDDMIWRSGFGIVNLMEVDDVNQDKWNEYIAANTQVQTWHQFGKLAMTAWMKEVLALLSKKDDKKN